MAEGVTTKRRVGRPSLGRKARSFIVRLRMTEAEYIKARQRADNANKTMSGYIRLRVFGGAVTDEDDDGSWDKDAL